MKENFYIGAVIEYLKMEQDILKFHFDKLPVLESERLLLREQTLLDAPALFKIRSNDAVMKYIPRPKPKSIADIEALLLKSGYVKEAHFKQDFYYGGQFLDTEIYCKVNA